MKPGDLVEIIDYGGYYSCDPPRIGMIVGFYGGVRVLPHEGIGRYALRDIRPLVNPDDGGYDSTKEST